MKNRRRDDGKALASIIFHKGYKVFCNHPVNEQLRRKSMRVLIVSDTHKDNRNYFIALNRERPLDYVIHCGDCGGDESLLEVAAGCPLYVVAGNTDYYSSLPREIMTDIAGYKIMITHGHHYYVNDGNEILKDYAMGEGCNLAFYGHTHVPEIDEQDEITVVNPGSLSYPRQEGKRPSYAVMEIDRKGRVHFEIRYI